MKKIKILAVIGSLRKGSLNRQLALEAKAIIGDRADFEILEYSDVPFMNEDIEFPAPEPVRRVREAVKAADGIWFFTPEYNHFFSGVLKNLIDWLSRPESRGKTHVLDGKPATISGVSLGMSGTTVAQDHLVTLISFLNMDVMNVPRVAIPYAMNYTDSQGKLALSDESYSFLKSQADSFIDFVKKHVQE
ncbi:NADPH-dependent FMN reductase [Thermoclostridium stercorarium subsp. stercorarium DSM 8532]|uniref:NADPH-dependent FMN reductase n=4 Tax=Thermoclostridium stercorarium TaxID=1510 RepID=L7VPL4_THES1|nr:NADPH-dependent FMN reductase [Thermoclostridium stercorarium]AGC68722.1 NADPH-dependent FMN reductase [Thermoclostridium stercorarium subsp. stercorarium DSM 8532]AGI39731.1 flavoprotein [Thermoclostridium stercorarium subsp. stercorarium DSM 8532]ANX01582.1 NADPH-dependent FMN reductase [Thermoclostridium stercorarium subsp. leptospartum DSM 9219]UZQ84701.1 NAD(P)H-dependent oxidoreductase [Thermoclostridium stercorarium]